jgi:antitoxin HicB
MYNLIKRDDLVYTRASEVRMMEERFAYKLPLVFEPQPEGGYTVTCPILPELITEGDTIAEALANAKDALIAIIEAYADLGRSLPPVLERVALDLHTPFWVETAVAT